MPGKFTSDAIEGRFGWYRQANGGNFFMSLKQLVQVEKKIRCLSLLQQKALERASRLALHDHLPMEKENCAAAAECLWLQDYLENINLEENSESDFSVIYFVSGYIARSVSRRRKCESCKQLLITNDECPPLHSFADNENLRKLLELIDRGGLAEPTEYCFVICCLATRTYEKIISCEVTKK